MPRIVDLGVTAYYWVPGDAGIADETAPTTTEIAAGENITQFVVSTTTVNPTASDTTNERSIAETANVVVPTVKNYEGSLVLFRDFTTGAPTASVDLLATFSDAGIVGWVVKRVGQQWDTAVAASDNVDVYKFMTDSPQVMGGTSEGFLKMTVPLLQQGVFKVGATVAAGA